MAKSFETNKPGHSEYGGIPGESKGTEKSSATQHREFGSGSDLGDRSSEFYDETKKTISDTYNKTADALNKTYDQAMAYGRENPGKLMLMGLGGGLVLGLLLASRNRRSGFNVEPVMNTISQMFSDVFRRRWV
jgi:ElaB/YqjD/DUF883 family membrane-anchored ribosome-binding protein